MTTQNTYQVETFNRGKLFAVTCTLMTGESQLLSNYYKTEKAAEKMLKKVLVQNGIA